MTEIQTNGSGHVKIADEVIAVIAGTAALEADGVAALYGNIADDIVKLGRKNLARGVSITADGEAVSITTNIVVKSGMKVQAVSREVQARVKTAVETMTGLTVTEVNVTVSASDKQRPA